MEGRSNLEDAIVIAFVIAAGCERCAEQAVNRAVRHRVAYDLIRQALSVVAGIRSHECFERAVGPEAMARMQAPLETAWKALQQSAPSTGSGCCAPPVTAAMMAESPV